jgi:hypothetical protein
MHGRRKDERYRLSVPGKGVLRVLRDVVVERFDGSEVYAVGDAPEAAGLELTLDTVEHGQAAGVRVRLKECTPVLVGGNVRYRLHFAILD